MFDLRWRTLGDTLPMGNKDTKKKPMKVYFENDVANTEGVVGRPRIARRNYLFCKKDR